MIHRMLAVAIVLASLSFASDASQPAAPMPLSFHAEARVDVDADGKFVKAEVPSDLPESVRRYIEQELGKWTYKRTDPGVPHGIATTWVDLRACAMPTASGAYSMGLAFNGSGPTLLAAGDLGMVARASRRLDRKVILHILIGEDGTATLESIEGGSEDLHANERFEKAVASWVATLRVQPELIDGKPVRARGTLPLEVHQGRRSDKPTKEELLAQALQSPQCKQAGNAPAAMSMQPADNDRLILVQPAI
jgi:hypothetical protein